MMASMLNSLLESHFLIILRTFFKFERSWKDIQILRSIFSSCKPFDNRGPSSNVVELFFVQIRHISITQSYCYSITSDFLPLWKGFFHVCLRAGHTAFNRLPEDPVAFGFGSPRKTYHMQSISFLLPWKFSFFGNGIIPCRVLRNYIKFTHN